MAKQNPLSWQQEQEAGSTCAVIVSFNPDIPVLMNLLGQIAEERSFVLVDNHSANLQAFRDQVSKLPNCLALEALPENRGLATALNIGIRRVMAAGFSHVCLFDQDSALAPGFFLRMEAAFASAEQEVRSDLAALGPRIENPDTGRGMPFKVFNRLFRRSNRQLAPGSLLYEAGFLITSGCLLSVAALKKIGLMKDEYFIDNVDLEWCFRASSKGFSLAGTDHAVLYHRIGEPSGNPLVRRGLLTQHSPLRSYYSTRNRMHLSRCDYAPLGWKLRDRARFFLKTLWLLLFSGARAEYWKQIRRGMADSRALS